MSITNKKIDALRRLLLGNLYQECKDNPMGVSRKQLEDHLEKIKGEGCIGDCSVDEFVKTCQLKTHYPTCVDGNYRSCVENIGERSTGVDKFYYNQYKNAKMFENEPDTEEEEEEEGEMCNVCGLTGDDDIGMPVQEMSCGHHSHVNCLIKVAQQKGRDNAECPECRKEYPLTEVPVPVRTLEQRQADSQRRYEFNASQMGLGGSLDEEEETEEDRLSNSIVQNISEHQIDEAIEEIRNFYTRDIRRTILSRYIKAWLNKIKIEITIGQMSFDDMKRLIDVIFETNAIISLNNRLIVDLYWIYEEEDNEETKEKIMYVIKAIINYYIRDNEDEMFSYFLQILMGENLVMFLEEVIRIVERDGVNDLLKNAFNLAHYDIDFTRIEDRTKELIINWFNSHNYQAPSFEADVAQQLSDAIIEHIENRYFMGAEAAIEEFYERANVEEIRNYVPYWTDELLRQINTEDLEMDNVVSLVDTIFASGRLLTLNINDIRTIRNIMRTRGPTQKEQCIYIVMRVSLILITEFPDEEVIGLLIENIIKAKALTLLRLVMKVADENNGVEILKGHLLDVIGYLTIPDSQPQNVINEWFTTHNFPLPTYKEEEDEEEEDEEDEDEDEEEVNPTRRLNFDEDDEDRPLQISSLTPPHERVRGGWFNRIRKY